MNNTKIAIVVSHPIQHFCPQYVSFSRHPDAALKVFFGSALGYKPYVDENFKEEISWPNLSLEKFDHVFLNGMEALPVSSTLDAPALEDALDEFAPDVVVIYGYFQKMQRRAYRWAKKNKSFIAYVSDGELRQRRKMANRMLRYFFLRKYFSKIDFFLTVGDENEKFYRTYGVPTKKFLRMHFPINVEQYKRSYADRNMLRVQIRDKYNLTSEEVVLSVVGKLVAWKNQDHIIDALAELEGENIYLVLFILGSGEKMHEWEQKSTKLKRSKVYFTGFVNVDLLPAYYAATDIYVHSASVEPHSIAVSEAVYMGCPVIISDRCGSFGVDDDVQPEKNGYVYRFGDIKQLASRIKSLASDARQRMSMSAYSHQIAVDFQHTSHEKALGELLDRLRR